MRSNLPEQYSYGNMELTHILFMTDIDLIETSRHILRIQDVKNLETDVSITNILSRSGCDLWITGTKHTKNIQDPQISILKKQFTHFKNQHYKNPIVYLEGFIPTHLEDEKSSVEKYGEKVILISMAKECGMEIKSVEPSQAEVSEWAIQLFPNPLAHAAWAMLNILMYSADSLKNILPNIAVAYGFKEKPEEFYKKISEYLREKNIADLPSDLHHLTESSMDKEKIAKAQEPDEGPFPTNKAGSAINLARDYGLFHNTIKTLEEDSYDGVFAWFGHNHVLAMMPAFEDYFI